MSIDIFKKNPISQSNRGFIREQKKVKQFNFNKTNEFFLLAEKDEVISRNIRDHNLNVYARVYRRVTKQKF